MNKLIAAIAAIASIFGVIAPAYAADPIRSPNWDLSLATQTADLPANQAELEDLFRLIRDTDTQALQHRLDAIITGGSLSQPARDAILFRFAIGLADFDEVDPEIMDRLLNVQPRVMVPHEERATVGVPLFNIAGAAEGTRRFHRRLEAREQAQDLLAVSASAWVDAFLLADDAQRPGFTDGLDGASGEQLAALLDVAAGRLTHHPELTPAMGKSALLTGNTPALQHVVRHGSGADLARILEAAAHTLPRQEALTLLDFAVSQAPAVNAALAIAQLYPALADLPESSDLLFSYLDDARLGATAALALATAGDPETRLRLQHISRGKGGLASVRARLALESAVRPAGLNR